MNSFRLHWDRSYGIYKRRGWSVFIDGVCVVTLERFLVVAIYKAFRQKR